MNTLRRNCRVSTLVFSLAKFFCVKFIRVLLVLQRLIETAPWGDDPAAIEQQLSSHQRFHNSVQRSVEVDRARDELVGRNISLSLNSDDDKRQTKMRR